MCRSPGVAGGWKQFQRGDDSPLLKILLPGRSNRLAHHIGCQQRTSWRHREQTRLEDIRRQNHRWDAALFDKPGQVSHGHVTDRSNRHQQDGLNPPILQAFDPERPGLVQQAKLGAGANKGICFSMHAANETSVSQLLKDLQREH